MDNNKRKILVITSLFPNHLQPDFGNFIFQRMAAFSRLEGNVVKAIAPVPYCPGWVRKEHWAVYRRIRRRETREGIEIFHPRYPLLPKIAMPFHGLLMASGILRLAARLHERHRFDLIDGHFIFPDGLAAVLAARMLKIPVVLSARGSDINQSYTFRTICPQIVYALRHADRIVSVCNALKAMMCDLGIPEKKIEVIPNGIDIKRFTVSDRFEARDRLGIPREENMILAVGGLIPRKGHDFIVRSLPMVLKRHPKARLHIVGEGPERSAIQAVAGALGLSERVKLVGHRPNADLGLWYNAADVFCLASLREGWANVIMESLSCGTPVVATNVFGASEIITNKNVGTLVEGIPEAIAEALSGALEGPWDRQIIREHVARRSWEVVAGEVRDVFELVLGRRNINQKIISHRNSQMHAEI